MRYNSSRIQQESRFITIDYLIHMIEIGRIDPNHAVGSQPNWNNRKKSQMVESLILGLPTETIWVEEDALGKTQLLSGFELFSCILDFKNNNLCLKGLRILKHLDGLYFSEIHYAEIKHFMQMEISINTIHHDSNQMLKCLFIESINKEKYGSNAGQLARNITFRQATNYIHNYTQEIFDNFEHDRSINKRTFESYSFKIQTEILYSLLLIYIEFNKHNIKYEVALESYSYSRSHTSFYSDYNSVKITPNDNLEIAINKLMFILEIDHSELQQELYILKDTIYNIFQYENIKLSTIGRNISNSNSLLKYVYESIYHDSYPLRITPLTSVQYLIDRL